MLLLSHDTNGQYLMSAYRKSQDAVFRDMQRLSTSDSLPIKQGSSVYLCLEVLVCKSG